MQKSTSAGRFKALIGALALLGAAGAHGQASAPAYPAKPVRIMVGFAPGGGTDVTSRLVAQKLSADLGQSVVVENRPGAAGSIAAEQVAKAPPDGYHLLMVASTTFIYATLQPNLPYRMERDFAPVSLVTVAPLVLVVHPSVPAHNAKELITLARSRPGQLNYGSDGVGGTSHLAGELFNMMGKVKLVHVPFKGGSASAVALASGQIDVNFPSLPAAMPLLKAKKYRALAVTSLKRSPSLPAVPTLDESGLPGYDVLTWYGLLAPAGMPRQILERLNAAVVKAVNATDVKEGISRQGMEAQASSSEQFAQFMRRVGAQIKTLAETASFKTSE